MTDARLAYSLETLRDEVNARWPGRNKASDGWIGNPAHQATRSDHNPNADGVVCALDLTNDPGSGADMGQLAEMLRLNRHPDVKYVIRHWDRQMFSAYPAHGVEPFTWREYTGAGASELHVSVGVGRDGESVEPYDDRDSWFVTATPSAPQEPTQEPPAVSVATDPPFVWVERSPLMRGSQIGWAQRVLRDGAEQDLGPTGDDDMYGRHTADGIENLQTFFAIGVDRKVGPETWGVLEYVGSLHSIV